MNILEAVIMGKDQKRRDSKGRILRTGEQQRQDGSYLYTYKGKDGKNHYVWEWYYFS